MTRIARLVPAILTDDPKALEKMVCTAETFTNYVQFDIMDGQFVPSKSITREHLANLTMKLKWEAHLMVMDPEKYLSGFHQAGAQRVIFHYEATSSPREVISQARRLGLKVGLAVNPETAIPSFLPLASVLDSVLFMTVHPGFYGSQFLPEVLDKIKAFRKLQPDMEIGVDGGIKENNITQVARAGVDLICVGSAIFLQPDPATAFRRLQTLV